MSDAITEEVSVSPAVAALRQEVRWLQNAIFALGNGNIKAREAQEAVEILAYLDGLAAKKVAELESQIASEMLGRPVKVEGGTKLSLAAEPS
jgi:hypothetical protein